ncbi:MAG: thermonuclease family protein [Hyphomicrobiales bacterium]|nr:thermonuclease family protein [Hyphomicrobiales bacterium]
MQQQSRSTLLSATIRSGRVVALTAVILVAMLTAGPIRGQESQGLEIVPRASRDVTPPGITPGPTIDGPLLREPLPPPPPEPTQWRRFFLPRTTNGATFVTRQNLEIRVYGVAPPALDQTCERANGEVWPCGRTALFSLRMLLRGRAVECFLPALDGIDRAIAPCRIGRIDIGHWLLRQGWALPDDNATEEYRALAREARCDRLGMWRGAAPEPDCPAADRIEPDPA